jgi:hypothetical protein
MRVMILAKSTPETENAEPNAEPNAEGFQAMARFTQQLMDADILLGAGRLQPSGKGARLRFERNRRRVIDGPFIEAKELVAGYWIWQVGSLEEAIEWLKRAPFDDGQELEIRPIYDWDLPATAASGTADAPVESRR